MKDYSGDAAISLVAVGDIQASRPFLAAIESGGPDYAEILAMLRDADMTIGNLEAPLTSRGHPMEKMLVPRSDPALIDDIAGLGLDVVSLANSHAMDYGYEGIAETMGLLDRRGILHVGTGPSLDDAVRPVMLEHKQVRVAFLGLASTLAHGTGASPERPGIAPIRARTAYEIDTALLEAQPGTSPIIHTFLSEEDTAYAATRIRAAKAETDSVVVMVHWGVAFRSKPEEYQLRLGHALVDAGADLVVGHHAHTFQPIEIYRGRCILYGVANFLFHYEIPASLVKLLPGDVSWKMSHESVLVRAGIVPGQPPAVTLVPVEIDAEGNPRRATAESASAIFECLDELSGPFGCRIELDPATGLGRPIERNA